MDIYIANQEVRCSSGVVKKGAQIPELDSEEIRYLEKARAITKIANGSQPSAQQDPKKDMKK